jgi:hypothetical protein
MCYISLFYTFVHCAQITNATGGGNVECYSWDKLLNSNN